MSLVSASVTNVTPTPTVTQAANITSATTMVYSPGDLWWALGIIIILASLIGVVYLYEISRAYNLAGTPAKREENVKTLLSSVQTLVEKVTSQATVSTADITQVSTLLNSVKDLVDEPTGIVGFTRGQIATTVIFILGVAVILIMFALKADPQIVNNIVSMLGATLAAVVGFYFGGKGATSGKG